MPPSERKTTSTQHFPEDLKRNMFHEFSCCEDSWIKHSASLFKTFWVINTGFEMVPVHKWREEGNFLFFPSSFCFFPLQYYLLEMFYRLYRVVIIFIYLSALVIAMKFHVISPLFWNNTFCTSCCCPGCPFTPSCKY